MGNSASRDALDLDLVRSEYEILTSGHSCITSVTEYGRMVDDISAILLGPFSNVIKIILLMSRKYPTMPLNIQYSFCYSRFLDVHLYNVLKPNASMYGLYSTLAWKELNSFCYQPQTSNKYPPYMDAVVPITMHRIQRRCTSPRDRRHHLSFILKILAHRGQDMNRVKKRVLQFKQKLKPNYCSPITKYKHQFMQKGAACIKYDKSTNSHKYSANIIRACDKDNLLKIVHTSLPSLEALLCPKRKIIKRISQV